MKYIKDYQLTADYNQAVEDGLQLPNVSLIEETTFCKYNALVAVVFTATADGATIAFSGASGITINFETSTDGVVWEEWDKSTITLTNEGDKVWVRGVGNSTFSNADGSATSKFTITKASIGGNIMGLLDKENSFEIVAPYAFKGLFKNNTTLAFNDLRMPADTITEGCYEEMFAGCVLMEVSPKLPAYKLQPFCYRHMFQGCTALTEATYLMSKKYKESCYEGMFTGCTNLTVAPYLRGEVLETACFKEMFKGCTSLKEVSCYAKDTTATDCTLNWMSGVGTGGQFYKNAEYNKWAQGVSGIPSGWTTNDIPEEEE